MSRDKGRGQWVVVRLVCACRSLVAIVVPRYEDYDQCFEFRTTSFEVGGRYMSGY
jgi:hypothetical protein